MMFYPLIAFVGTVVRDIFTDMGMDVKTHSLTVSNPPSVVINIHSLISAQHTWISWDASLFYNTIGATSFERVGL